MSWLEDVFGCLGCLFDVWMLYYLLPIIAIGIGLWFILDGNYIAAGLWIAGGLALGVLIYGWRSRNLS